MKFRGEPSAGCISEERLALIPPRHWICHEFCFYLHDQMARLLSDYEASEIHLTVEKAFAEYCRSRTDLPEDTELVALLRKDKSSVAYRHHLVSHLVFALTADMLHFQYEAFMCLERRKFNVAFSLLRKPFKENLLFLSWILVEEDDFLAKFDFNPHETLNGIAPERRKQILRSAIEKLPTKELFDPDLLHDLIFSKTCASGFEPLWQRASHLVTSQGQLLRTEPLDLNLLFLDPRRDELFDHGYAYLPYVMVFAVQVCLECFARIIKYNETTVSHLLLVTLGCYESLFRTRRPSVLGNWLSKALRDFLKCPHCSKKYRLTRAKAARLYLNEVIRCGNCALESPFPLYWILAVSKVRVVRDGCNSSIFEEALHSK